MVAPTVQPFSEGFEGLRSLRLGIEIDVGAKLATSEIPAWYDTVNIVIVCIFVLAPWLFKAILACCF